VALVRQLAYGGAPCPVPGVVSCTRGAVQDFNCVQMRASGCNNHYKFVIAAEAKAKTVTPAGAPGGAGAARTAGHKTVLFS